MYLDQILFLIGAALFLLALILAAFLIFSRKKSREYRQALLDETQRLDVVSTIRETQRLSASGSSGLSQENGLTAMSSGGGTTEMLSTDAAETELLLDAQGAAAQEHRVGEGLDLSPLEGKYELLRELSGGAMSRVFLARHCKLGNEWLVKYVQGAELANEAEVLKQLNHISLPQIIDIFDSGSGIFLVERYIEGCTLADVLELGGVKEGQIRDWGIQLAQVLRYLHTLDTPIIHCDLKPSNIMVTYDDRLVLIDFGISKQQGVQERDIGITYGYAAPEQFQGKAAHSAAVASRFGKLPPEQSGWRVDQRTDLYSAGAILYALLTGRAPDLKGQQELSRYASAPLSDVICKCLEVDPALRYQSARELEDALTALKGRQTAMARSLVMRRVAAVCCGALLTAGAVTSGSAAYVNRQENLSNVEMEPTRAVVTAQQSVPLDIEKISPDGKIQALSAQRLTWSFSEDNIAQMDGERLVGLNVGETVLYGQYRNKPISLDVTVTEPVAEMTEISLRYPLGTEVAAYAGSGEREQTDGTLDKCAFVSPETLSADGGALYISDSGCIRVLEDGRLTTLPLEPSFLTVDRVRGFGGDLYVQTGPWEAEDGVSYYGIMRIAGKSAEFLYYTEAVWSTISDFVFSSDGTLWFIQENMGTGVTALYTLDSGTQEPAWAVDLPDGADSLAFDSGDNLYISVPESGVILRLGRGETQWTYFAGMEGENHFIDGTVANFYRPTSLAVHGSYLYVLDYDTVRRIAIEGAGGAYTETVAGIPVPDTNPAVALGAGDRTSLPASELACLGFDGEGRLLLTDPKNNVIYEIRGLEP